MPLTKSRLDCGFLLSLATTDYSRLLKIQLAGFLDALDSNHFPPFVFLGLLIGRREKKSNFAGFSETDSPEKSADFAGIFRANITENQSVNNG